MIFHVPNNQQKGNLIINQNMLRLMEWSDLLLPEMVFSKVFATPKLWSGFRVLSLGAWNKS